MTFLVEWQRQQKVLKDGDRERRKRASLERKMYRGGEHDIKHQRQQKALKDADRYNKRNASMIMNSYRGGEHDIQHEMSLKILKDVEQGQQKRATLERENYRGGEHDINHHQQQKALKEAERYSKANASIIMKSFRGGDYERDISERRNKSRSLEKSEYCSPLRRSQVASFAPWQTSLKLPATATAELFRAKNKRDGHSEPSSFSSVSSATEIPIDSDHSSLRSSFRKKMCRDNSLRKSFSLKSLMMLSSSIFSSSKSFDDSNIQSHHNTNNNSSNNDEATEGIVKIKESSSIDSHNCIGYDFSMDAIDCKEGYEDASDDNDISPSQNDSIDINANRCCDSCPDSPEKIRNNMNVGTSSVQSLIVHVTSLEDNIADKETRNPENSDECKSSASSSSDSSSMGNIAQDSAHTRFPSNQYHSQDDPEFQTWGRSERDKRGGHCCGSGILDSNKEEHRFASLRGIMFNGDKFIPLHSDIEDQELENQWKKVVRFVEDEDDRLKVWWDSADRHCNQTNRNFSTENFSNAFDIYNEALDCPYYDESIPQSNYSKDDFYRLLYTDESEEMSIYEYDSDNDESNPNNKFILSFLYLVVGDALWSALKGIWERSKKNSNTRTSTDDLAIGEEMINFIQTDAATAASVINSGSSASTGMRSTIGVAAYSLKLKSTTSAVSSGTTSASALVSAPSLVSSTSASMNSATSSATVASVSTTTASSVGAVPAVTMQIATVNSMATSAAGIAAKAVAVASSQVAAIASATSTASTIATTVVATTAVVGVVAISTVSPDETVPSLVTVPDVNTEPILCPEIPVKRMARMKINFARDSDSLAVDLLERGDSISLGSQIMQAYNNISEGCNETHQRSMLNCSYKFSEFVDDADMIETYWESFVTCNNSCPVEDPLFGIDTLDPVMRLLQDLNPTYFRKKQPMQPTSNDITSSLGRTLSSSIGINQSQPSSPNVNHKVPVSQKEFLIQIGAASVDPWILANQEGNLVDGHTAKNSTTTNLSGKNSSNFTSTFLESATPTQSTRPSSFPSSTQRTALSTVPSLRPSLSPTISMQSSFPSNKPSAFPSNEPSSIPSSSPSDSPSGVPSPSPSNKPSEFPSHEPSTLPSLHPSVSPSDVPSSTPSLHPSVSPSDVPSSTPSDMPSRFPSNAPSTLPSLHPSVSPSDVPSSTPSDMPSRFPSNEPSSFPSSSPSVFPSDIPSSNPSDMPSKSPSQYPSTLPSVSPSAAPSREEALFKCTREFLDDNDYTSDCNTLTPPPSCQINNGCGEGIPQGFYPDLTRADSYCYCSGSIAPSAYQQCTSVEYWDGFPGNSGNYIIGSSVSGIPFGEYGLWGTVGGTCVLSTAVSDETKKRPPHQFWFQLGNDFDGEVDGDESGRSVSLSSDGQIVAIGAPENDENGLSSGHVRVYQWSGTSSTWTQLGDDIDGKESIDDSGIAVSLSNNGHRVAVGARYADDGPEKSDSGHVRVYQWDGNSSSWIQLGSDINGEESNEYSGSSVSLSADGQVVAIGARKSSFASLVRIYQWDDPSSTWIKLGNDIDAEADDDYLGNSVSLSSDGQIVAIGVPRSDENGLESGYTRVYHWSESSSTWIQLGNTIVGAPSDYFGTSVSLSDNGQIVAIGGPNYSSTSGPHGCFTGHVEIYKWNDSSSTWDQLGNDIEGETARDFSGHSVSLSADGQIVAIAAWGNDDNGENSGHVRVYQLDDSSSTWAQLGIDIDGEAEDDMSGMYGLSLSGDGKVVAIGSHRNDGNGPDSGHVRIFTHSE